MDEVHNMGRGDVRPSDNQELQTLVRLCMLCNTNSVTAVQMPDGEIVAVRGWVGLDPNPVLHAPSTEYRTRFQIAVPSELQYHPPFITLKGGSFN